MGYGLNVNEAEIILVGVSHAYLGVAFFFVVTAVTVFLAITDPVQGYASVISALVVFAFTVLLDFIYLFIYIIL